MSLKAKLIAKLPPATVADARRDYKQHHAPETLDAAKDQSEQAKAHGKANASAEHGRRT